MRRVDLHDDALLDRARQKTLSASEHERLVTHCRSCAACALELGWIEDGIHSMAPSAGDRTRGHAAVDAVLGAVTQAPRSESMAAPKARVHARVGRARKRRAVALAFAGLFASSAAAAYFTGAAEYAQTQWQHVSERFDTTDAAVSKRRVAAHTRAAKRSVTTLAAPEAFAVNAPVVIAPAPAPASAELPLKPSAAGIAPDVVSLPARQASAAALFASANAARAAGDHASAEARYSRLSQAYAGTRAELVSRVSRGNLWLSALGDPVRAREAFASYLAARPDGILAQEARVGLARALAKLGREEDERAAWAALIERHPSSLHVAYARARIAELSSR